jgi:potassium-dependent mechanosensitive channel
MSRVGVFPRLMIAVLLAAFVGFSAPAAAQVQQVDREYYLKWSATAKRAEEAIDTRRASNASLENLRSEIAGYRDVFIAARDQHSARINTLQSQLDALGPVPESGEESADIADLRQNLTAQLNELRVPRVVSGEAYSRANGLIGEIDKIIRDRQTRALLSRGPSPLNPSLWAVGAEDLREVGTALWNETRVSLQSQALRERVRQQAPAILLLALVGAILLLWGGRWSERLGNYLRSYGGGGTGVWGFIVSLARMVLPFIGIVALVAAVMQSNMLGVRGTLILEAVPAWGATFLAFNWLASRLYPKQEDQNVIPQTVGRRAEMRLYINLLALVLVWHDAIGLYEEIENISDGSRAVVGFFPIVFAALLLLRLQHVGLRHRAGPNEVAQDGLTQTGIFRLVPYIRKAALVLGVISPLLAASGYGAAAEAIVYPAIRTLAALSAILILHRFVEDIYAWLSGKGDAARDSLFSVLAGFLLTIISLPVFFLIWGAREADLTEIWAGFLRGVQIGGSRVSPTDFVAFALIFAAGYGATRLLQGGLRTSLLPKTNIDPGGQSAIVSGVGYVGITLAGLVAVTGAGLDLSSLAIVAGALSVGIGFGLQNIVSNFVSGIILLVERPVSKGDWIEVGGQMGYVRDISVRSTRIETFDRTDVIVPNSDLISGTVTNYTRGNTIGRVIVPVGVAYGTDTRRVETILLEIAAAHPMVLANPAPSVAFRQFGADSLDFEIRAILRDVNWTLSVRSDLNHEIARRFTEEKIEIPFAQRDIWLRNPEALTGGATPGPGAQGDDSGDPESNKP